MRGFFSSMRALRAEQQQKCTIIIYYTISMRVFSPACAYCARSNTTNAPSLFNTIYNTDSSILFNNCQIIMSFDPLQLPPIKNEETFLRDSQIGDTVVGKRCLCACGGGEGHGVKIWGGIKIHPPENVPPPRMPPRKVTELWSKKCPPDFDLNIETPPPQSAPK